MKDWAARVSTGAVASALLLLAVPLAWSIVAAAEVPDCPFADKQPPMDEILKLPARQRPSLCEADLRWAKLARAGLSGADLRSCSPFSCRLWPGSGAPQQGSSVRPFPASLDEPDDENCTVSESWG